jgi:hypothetical protein
MTARAHTFVSGGEDAPAGCSDSLARRGETMAVGPRPGRHHFLRNVAYHESGHATTSRLLGLLVAACTVEFVNGHHGCTWAVDPENVAAESVEDLCTVLTPMLPSLFDDRNDIANELLQAHHHVVSLLAGPISEELFIGERLPGSGHDDEEAADIGRLIARSASALPAYLAFARCEALALLLDHRRAVELVADALLVHRSLDGVEIDALIGATTRSLAVA